MKTLKLARKFIESQGGFVTTQTHVQCIFCDQSVAIYEMGSACPLCGHEYTIEDIQMAMRRPIIKISQNETKNAATLSGLYNCEYCGEEKCADPGICDDCLAPPTEFELNHDDESIDA